MSHFSTYLTPAPLDTKTNERYPRRKCIFVKASPSMSILDLFIQIYRGWDVPTFFTPSPTCGKRVIVWFSPFTLSPWLNRWNSSRVISCIGPQNAKWPSRDYFHPFFQASAYARIAYLLPRFFFLPNFIHFSIAKAQFNKWISNVNRISILATI